MKIYTKTGDKGQTGLRGGTRVSKAHPRVDAYGDIDETNAHLGLALAFVKQRELQRELKKIQADLFEIGALLSSPSSPPKKIPKKSGTLLAQTTRLERSIDRMEKKLPALRAFILPGGSHPGALLHVCRTACRRAERKVLRLGKSAPRDVVIYLNRLSDFLFVAARWANKHARKTETPWRSR